MKKILFLLQTAALLAFAAGCAKTPEEPTDGDEPPVTETVFIVKNEADKALSFDDAANETTVSFTAKTAWTAKTAETKAASWLSVFPEAGEPGEIVLTIKTIPNDTPEPRQGQIVISSASGKGELQFNVLQAQKDALVIAEQKEYKFDKKGGVIRVTVCHNVDYTIDIEGGWILQAETKAYEKDRLAFLISENEGEGAREGKIVFTSRDGNLSQEISVLQEGIPQDFVITLEDVTETFVEVYVQPRNPQMRYVSTAVLTSSIAGIDDETLFQYELDYFKNLAETNEMTLSQVLKQQTQQGNQTRKGGGLTPGTSYTVYAYGIDTGTAERLTDICRFEFKTVAIPQIEAEFEIDAKVDKQTIEVTYTPKNYDGYYYHGSMKGTKGNESQEEINAGIMRYFLNLVDAFRVQDGLSDQQILDTLCSRGPSTKRYENLASEERHMLYAMAVNEKAFMCSDVSHKWVTTEAIPTSDNQLSLEVSDIHGRQVNIAVKATNNDPYIVLLFESEELHKEWMTDSLIIDQMIGEELWRDEMGESLVKRGDSETKVRGLKPETDYTVCAVGYEGEIATTRLFKTEFTTGPNVVNDIQVSISYSPKEFYDHMEVKRADPSGYGTVARPGFIFLPVVPHSSRPDCEFHWGFYKKSDFNDPRFTDEAIIENLVAMTPKQPLSRPYEVLSVPYGFHIKGCAVAIDENGDPSKLFKGNEYVELHKNKDNVNHDVEAFLKKYPWNYSVEYPYPYLSPASMAGPAGTVLDLTAVPEGHTGILIKEIDPNRRRTAAVSAVPDFKAVERSRVTLR